MKRLMMATALPLISVLAVAVIAIPIGILFILVDDASSPDGTLIVAVVLTAVVMAGAVGASISASKKPMLEAVEAAPAQRKAAAPEVGARVPKTDAPRRGARRSRGK